MTTTSDKRRRFRELHESSCFVLPNPWDAGSARLLTHLGFTALATTSSGSAWSSGKPDGGVSRDAVLAYIRTVVEATDLPVNADFEHGYADDLDDLRENVRLCIETGVAGLSIEDSTGNPEHPLFDIDVAVARIKVAREAIDAAGGDVVLTGRAENFFTGNPDMDDALQRIKAYAEAGADCLYVPAISTPQQIQAVVDAVAPRPVNLLVGSASELTVKDYAAMGVRRISIGGGLSLVGWDAVIRAATGLVEEGSFAGLLHQRPSLSLNTIFAPHADA